VPVDVEAPLLEGENELNASNPAMVIDTKYV
jgi:hypothetical protein